MTLIRIIEIAAQTAVLLAFWAAIAATVWIVSIVMEIPV